MEARNRTLKDWFTRVRTGQILLPRFQRHEAWGHKEVSGLLESVLRELPTGAALILEVGDEEPFIARPLVGAPEPSERVTEHLLDGQQRLTALWRALHDDYEDRVYLVGTADDEEGSEQLLIRAEPTYFKKGERYPLWLFEPSRCWKRGLIPLALCGPEADLEAVDAWVDAAASSMAEARLLDRRITAHRSTIENFNIPFLSLPPTTDRETALEVFINMNTSSVRLSSYDIVVAQYEAATGDSLHDQVEELETAVPRLGDYRSVENLLLDVASLREDRVPSQASYHRLDLALLSDNLESITAGAAFAVQFLESESVFDSERLPTIAVVPVLAAVEPHLPRGGDARGNALSLLRAYLWRSFTTSRYESSAGTRVLQDLRGLIAALEGQANSAPIFDEEQYHVPGAQELLRAGWPKARQTLARAILCASLRRGAFDLADGERASVTNLARREYHHLFPDAYLRKEAKLGKSDIYRALNCSLITWTTNRKIGAKPPLTYMRQRVELSAQGETEVRRRLESHLIPWDEFVAAESTGAEEAYRRFLDARAELVADDLAALCLGAEP